MTKAEYLEWEDTQEANFEYIAGWVRCMSGGTAEHSRVKVNLVRILDELTDGSNCLTFDADMRVQCDDEKLTYPDAAVACGDVKFADAKKRDLLNPVLVAEVLSPSTEGYDRGEKFEHYASIASLKHYMLVSTVKPAVTLYSRENDHWRVDLIVGLDAAVSLESIGIELPIAELYRRVEFPELESDQH